MHEVKLRAVDLNLLTLLGALLRHASVTRAATELGMSQPAVSRALGRLRALLGDGLLVRGPGGALLPTPRAQALAPRVAALLAEAADLVTPAGFDPGQLRSVMRLAATDHDTLMLLPRLVPRLATEAPGLALRILPITATTPEELAAGRVDLVFSVLGQPLPGSLRQLPLYRDGFVTLLRAGHPALGAWSLDRYCALDHILVSVTGSGTGAVDEALAAQGRRRRVALWLPHFHAAMRMVAVTEMAVTLPRSLALLDEAGGGLAARGLAMRDPPLPVPGFTITAIWPEVLANAPAHRWLRGHVAQAARGLPHVLPP